MLWLELSEFCNNRRPHTGLCSSEWLKLVLKIVNNIAHIGATSSAWVILKMDPRDSEPGVPVAFLAAAAAASAAARSAGSARHHGLCTGATFISKLSDCIVPLSTRCVHRRKIRKCLLWHLFILILIM
jgi:hypothetical protein